MLFLAASKELTIEQIRNESKWLLHKGLGPQITKTLSLAAEAQKQKTKGNTNTSAFFDELKLLLSTLSDIAQDKEERASEEILELLNLQFKNGDGKDIPGAKLMSWLCYPEMINSFFSLIDALKQTNENKVILLLQCFADFYSALTVENRTLLLNKATEIEPDWRTSVALPESSIGLYRALSTRNSTALLENVEYKNPIINLFYDHAPVPMTLAYKLHLIRAYLWTMPIKNVNAILTTALQDSNDPLFKLMRQGGKEYIERLVLDYMFICNEIKEGREEFILLESFNNRHHFECFSKYKNTFIFITTPIQMAQMNKDNANVVSGRKKTMRESVLEWPAPYSQALFFNSAMDPLGLGQDYLSPDKSANRTDEAHAQSTKQAVLQEFYSLPDFGATSLYLQSTTTVTKVTPSSSSADANGGAGSSIYAFLTGGNKKKAANEEQVSTLGSSGGPSLGKGGTNEPDNL